MNEKILVPALGESITEATVAKWLKNAGDKVSADEPIVELETDKVNLEVPSPINGYLENVSSKEGDTVEVGSVLGVISNSETNITEEKKENFQDSEPKIEINNIEEDQKVLKDNIVNLEKKEKKINKTTNILEEEPNEEPLVLDQEITDSDSKNDKVFS